MLTLGDQKESDAESAREIIPGKGPELRVCSELGGDWHETKSEARLCDTMMDLLFYIWTLGGSLCTSGPA